MWGFDSEKTVCSERLEPHLRYLIQRLALPRPDIAEDIRMMMEALGRTIEIDEYRD
ncbi:hypothetical protein [Paraburkholderia sp.]|uniref:hypothetical protein n=1 Tax=Paraburkholderia sp. TaxID=1926495 RepID=UPI0039E6A78B